MEKIELGDRVKDRITGYAGIAHAMTIWLNGCVRVAVQPESLDKDGKVVDDRYFDAGQLIIVKKQVHKAERLVTDIVPEDELSVSQKKQGVKYVGGPERESGNYKPQMSTNNVR